METLHERKARLQERADEKLQEWYGHLPDNCEMCELASLVCGRTVEHFTENEFPAYGLNNFNEVLGAMRKFFVILRSQLNPLNPALDRPDGGTYGYDRTFYVDHLDSYHKSQNPEGWLSTGWPIRNDEVSLLALLQTQGTKEEKYVWPMDDLSYVCGVYLRSPWLQCGMIDRMLVRAMLYQGIVTLGSDLTFMSLNRYTKAYEKREAKATAWAVLGVIVAGLVGLGAAIQHGWWAGLIGALGFLVLFQTVDHLANGESRTRQSSLIDRLDHMHKAFLLAGKTASSVVLLRERFAAIDGGKGEHLPSEIFSILDCAIARGVVLLGHDREKRVMSIA